MSEKHLRAAFREAADKVAEAAWNSDYVPDRAVADFMADDRVRALLRAPTPEPQEKPSGLAAIMGKWPGDETDEEIAEAMEGESRWRPIETAPKDGTTVIVARDMDAWGWVLGHARYVVHGPIEGWISHGFTDPPGDLGLAHPTHWMPLPPAPGEETPA